MLDAILSVDLENRAKSVRFAEESQNKHNTIERSYTHSRNTTQRVARMPSSLS